jgi:trafficking protein particle complex subunit 6
MSFETPLPPFNASDPSATFVNASCMELLMIELVPLAYRMANHADAGAEGANGLKERDGEREKERGKEGSAEGKMDEDEERDAVFYRLEMLGYRVGQGLVERYVYLFFMMIPGACIRLGQLYISLSASDEGASI